MSRNTEIIRGTCCVCHRGITAYQSVAFFTHGNVTKHAHDDCVSDEAVEFAETIGVLVEYGEGREIEDYAD